jgi:hypothetical protein
MHYYWALLVSAFSIALPLTASLFRYRLMRERYLPLIILFMAGLANEITSTIMVTIRRNNSVNSNCYTLAEYLLFLWLFYKLRVINRQFVITAAITGILFWAGDNLFVNNLHQYNDASRIMGSLMVVWLSMERGIQLVYNGPGEPYRRTDLIFCICFFTYYAYQSFISIFDLFPMGVPANFYTWLWLVLGLINLLMNIVYTLVILWMPKPKAFTLP